MILVCLHKRPESQHDIWGALLGLLSAGILVQQTSIGYAIETTPPPPPQLTTHTQFWKNTNPNIQKIRWNQLTTNSSELADMFLCSQV
jgi:hypothetical protein